jgi:DNA-binding MarR family transcriptional regulator
MSMIASPSPAPRTAATGCTCSKLRRLTRRVTAVYDRALAPSGMRVTQYSLLAQLRRVRDLSMSQLADALDMDRTTLTRNLKPLLEAGWVELLASAQDGRVRVVRITAAGDAQWQAARAYWRRAQDEVKETIGLNSLNGLHQMLDQCLPLFRPVSGPEGETE